MWPAIAQNWRKLGLRSVGVSAADHARRIGIAGPCAKRAKNPRGRLARTAFGGRNSRDPRERSNSSASNNSRAGYARRGSGGSRSGAGGQPRAGVFANAGRSFRRAAGALAA